MMEVVFEVGDPACPLTRFTEGAGGVKGVCRITHARAAQGIYRGVLVLGGDDDTLTHMVKSFLNADDTGDVTVVSETDGARVLKVAWKGSGFTAASGLPAQCVQSLTQVFGPDTIIEPMVLDDGHMRVRCLIPQSFDTTGVIRKLQDMQRSMPVKHFRVIRVNEFTALQYADVLRRILTPDEEDLLRIALDLGYYETPKRCTLEAIASCVGLSVSPVHKRLKNVEQILVNAHVSPGTLRAPPARRRVTRRMDADRAAVSGAPREIALRVRWPEYVAASLTGASPEARAVVQPAEDDATRDESVALVVLAASESQYAPFVTALRDHPAVRGVDYLTRDAEHASFKLRTDIADGDTWREHPLPFNHILSRLGRDAFMKHAVVEGTDVWLRFVILRDGEVPLGADDLRAAVDAPAAALDRPGPVDATPAAATADMEWEPVGARGHLGPSPLRGSAPDGTRDLGAGRRPAAPGPATARAAPAGDAYVHQDAVARLAEVAEDASWEDMELVSLRALSDTPALAPVREPEKLTPRQTEILKIAHALGYYKTPRECTLGDIAHTLGISANAIHKNLTAAEQKIISGYLTALD